MKFREEDIGRITSVAIVTNPETGEKWEEGSYIERAFEFQDSNLGVWETIPIYAFYCTKNGVKEKEPYHWTTNFDGSIRLINGDKVTIFAEGRNKAEIVSQVKALIALYLGKKGNAEFVIYTSPSGNRGSIRHCTEKGEK